MTRELIMDALNRCEPYVIPECCRGCPYEGCWETKEECITQLHADTYALLKAQEPVKPVLDIDTWRCGNCGHTLENQQLLGYNVLFHEQYNYCPECGRAVKCE